MSNFQKYVFQTNSQFLQQFHDVLQGKLIFRCTIFDKVSSIDKVNYKNVEVKAVNKQQKTPRRINCKERIYKQESCTQEKPQDRDN